MCNCSIYKTTAASAMETASASPADDLSLAKGVVSDGGDDDDEFYTPGLDSLYASRVVIADHSLQSAQRRVQRQYDAHRAFDSVANLLARRDCYAFLRSSLTLQGTQPVSSRFTSAVAHSGPLGVLAVASWDGGCYFVDPSDLAVRSQLPGLHPEKVSGLQWSPTAASILATGGSDGTLNIVANPLDASSAGITPLTGHLARINDVCFHPLGRFVASASADLSWRLWDVETAQELYYQEGHTDSVNTVSIHPDGSLLASAGNDSVVKLWDLRSGKSVMDLHEDGHIKSVHALDWRSNGYHLASGGADAQLLLWDVRMGKKVASVLAHDKLISNVQFSPSGEFLVSTGYDGVLSLTASDSWIVFHKFKTLDKIMACDLFYRNGSNDYKDLNIVTGGWDRSVKLYNTNDT